MLVGETHICVGGHPAGVGDGVAVGAGVAVDDGVGVGGAVRINVTTTILFGRPDAEKVMFWV